MMTVNSLEDNTMDIPCKDNTNILYILLIKYLILPIIIGILIQKLKNVLT